MTRPADIYLRFLQLTDTLRGLTSLPSLDPLEERILALVARASQAHERLSVRDMMARSELGSPAMLHARLKSMREKGWVSLADTDDARRKQIELTQAALLHFDDLSACLVKAARNG
ncbi:winged helix-turn-helix domain-containing protein [Paraburkholderia sp. BCC1886]|uniref:winged helix-turn-helix domain-containing protein n=1 Tax=Paraburkholderia sp. BCC1886 TaxID=2562670 RepID=UPI0011841EA2|nr:winged helix-turn-helix domain-containing protein [Paraburkholderia sp. BCC1886]